MGGRKKRHGECVYCGKVCSLSEDHVPPKGLWGKPYPRDLIVVPSCKNCNDGFSKDDEYFRTILAISENVQDHPVVKQVLPIVHRSLTRIKAPGLPREILKSTRMVYRQRNSGIYESAPLYEMNRLRIERVIRRIIQGLFFHHFGRCLAPTHFVSSVMIGMIPTNVPQVFEPLLRAFIDAPYQNIGNGGFIYSVLIDNKDPNLTFWIFIFYGKCYFLGFTRPKELITDPDFGELIIS